MIYYCKNYERCQGTTTDDDLCGIEGHECNQNCVFTCIVCDREEEEELLNNKKTNEIKRISKRRND